MTADKVIAMEGHNRLVVDKRGGVFVGSCECGAFRIQTHSKARCLELHDMHLESVGSLAGLVSA